MRHAKNLKKYNEYYEQWKNLDKTFKSISHCMPPIPPHPKVIRRNPPIVNKCHEAYKLGYSLGSELGNLVNKFTGTINDFELLNKCLGNYVAYKLLKDSVNEQVDGMCFDKGRKEALHIQESFIGDKSKYDAFQKARLTEISNTLSSSMGIEKYINDLLNN